MFVHFSAAKVRINLYVCKRAGKKVSGKRVGWYGMTKNDNKNEMARNL